MGSGPNANFYGADVYSAQPFSNDLSVYRRKGLSLEYLETLTVGIAAPQGTVNPKRLVVPYQRRKVQRADLSAHENGPKGPVATLGDIGEIPVNVDVTPARKLVAVSNERGLQRQGKRQRLPQRPVEPSRNLTYGNDLLLGQGVAIDPQGNCFWSFDDLSKPSAPGSIVEFSGCSGTRTLVKSGITSAGGMTFDRNGNLYYIDEASGIYKCREDGKLQLFATAFRLAGQSELRC